MFVMWFVVTFRSSSFPFTVYRANLRSWTLQLVNARWRLDIFGFLGHRFKEIIIRTSDVFFSCFLFLLNSKIMILITRFTDEISLQLPPIRVPHLRHHHVTHWGPYFENVEEDAVSKGSIRHVALRLGSTAMLDCRVAMLSDKTVNLLQVWKRKTKFSENTFFVQFYSRDDQKRSEITFSLTAMSQEWRFFEKQFSYFDFTRSFFPLIYLIMILFIQNGDFFR